MLVHPSICQCVVLSSAYSSTPYYNKYSRASSADVGFQYSEELNHAPSYSQNAFQAVARHSSYDTYGSGTPRPLAYGTRAYAAGLQDSRGSAMGSASGYIQYGSGNAAKNSAQTGAYAVSETHAGTPRSGKAAMYVPDTYTVTGYQGATEYQGQGSYKMSTGAADGQGSLQTPTYMPEGMTMAADYGFRFVCGAATGGAPGQDPTPKGGGGGDPPPPLRTPKCSHLAHFVGHF